GRSATDMCIDLAYLVGVRGRTGAHTQRVPGVAPAPPPLGRSGGSTRRVVGPLQSSPERIFRVYVRISDIAGLHRWEVWRALPSKKLLFCGGLRPPHPQLASLPAVSSVSVEKGHEDDPRSLRLPCASKRRGSRGNARQTWRRRQNSGRR